ncbi:MAG: hypothetical protein AMXMBFR44_2140 [Candidatus Campbellbacteria bacterium]
MIFGIVGNKERDGSLFLYTCFVARNEKEFFDQHAQYGTDGFQVLRVESPCTFLGSEEELLEQLCKHIAEKGPMASLLRMALKAGAKVGWEVRTQDIAHRLLGIGR